MMGDQCCEIRYAASRFMISKRLRMRARLFTHVSTHVNMSFKIQLE